MIDKTADILIKIRDEIVKSGGKAPSVLCVICGLSNAAYQRSDGVYIRRSYYRIEKLT